MAVTIGPDGPVGEDEFHDEVARLNRDIREASATMHEDEVRYLVSCYISWQKTRVAAGLRRKALLKTSTPHRVIAWAETQGKVLEQQLRLAMQRYAKNDLVGQWLLSLCGVGPVVAAGLLATIDWTKPTAGSVWRFAGLDPTVTWGPGQKRPWNAQLKRLCFLAGESFVKTQNREEDVYGKCYALRKDSEWARNLAGELAEQAEFALSSKKWRKDTDAYAWYTGQICPDDVIDFLADVAKRKREAKTAEEAKGISATLSTGDLAMEAACRDEITGVPMLPPAHIHRRATRWAVKLMLSHSHSVGYWIRVGKPPAVPYPFLLKLEDHVHLRDPPNMDLIPGFPAMWNELKERNGLR